MSKSVPLKNLVNSAVGGEGETPQICQKALKSTQKNICKSAVSNLSSSKVKEGGIVMGHCIIVSKLVI